MAHEAAVAQFIETTGAEDNVARFFVDSTNGDVERAIDAFFESGGALPGSASAEASGGDDDVMDQLDEEELTALEESTAGAPAPAGSGNLLDDLFSRAEKVSPTDLEKEQNDPKRSIFKGKGFALGKEAEAESEVVDTGPAKPKPKAYKVTVWQGGAFQVNDGDVRYPDRGPDQEKNKRFMADLMMNIPPEEMRERDAAGMPIPVNISLADRREEDASNATVVKPKFAAFQGGGQALGKDWTSEAFNKVAAAADPRARGSGGAAEAGSSAAQHCSQEELASQLQEFAKDASSPDVTSVQLRLPSGQRAEARLRDSRTIGDLRQWLVASGHVGASERFVLSAGFPPQPLADDGASLKEASLCNAAVIVRLA